MSFEIEQARVDNVASTDKTNGYAHHDAVYRVVNVHLPDAIELIEAMAQLLERARGMTPFGDQWFDDVEAVLAKVRKA